MSLATNARSTAYRLLTKYGEDALYKSVTLTDVPASGTVTEGGTTYSVKALRAPAGRSYANDGQDVALKTFQNGTLQVKATEKVYISPADLTTTPKPGDVLTWGTSDVAANRRRVVSVSDMTRPQGTDVLYTVEVEK